MPRLLLALVTLVWAALAQAASCPDTFPVAPPKGRPQLDAAAQSLAALNDDCLQRADYYAYRGVVALERGDAEGAVVWLERALLLHPDQPGVEVDYARALALTGDRSSAANLARSLLARPDLPPTVAAFLPQELRTWNESAQWTSQFSVATLMGRETNLNSAPQTPYVTLTLGTGGLALQLAPQFQPKGGSAALVLASGVVGREVGDDAVAFVGQVQARGSDGSTDYQQADLAALWRHELHTGGVMVRVDGIQSYYGGANLYQSFKVESAYDWPVGPCQPRLGGQANTYTYPVSPELAGHYFGLLAGGTCQAGVTQWRGQVSLGRDLAVQNDRPGGNQNVQEVALGWNRPLGRGTVDVQGLVDRMLDAGGYSPLLSAGATRDVHRQYLRLEYDHPLWGNWEFMTYAESNRQDSNLSLFQVTDQALYAGLRWKTR